MSQYEHIMNFTSADIERYQKGLLSSAERHAMEKAALEDPFLAEAMDGFDEVPVPVTEDMASLQARLSKRIEAQETKIVPLLPAAKRSYGWLRVAAMITLVLSAALLIYRYSSEDEPMVIADSGPVSPKKSTTPAQPASPDNLKIAQDTGKKIAAEPEPPKSRSSISDPSSASASTNNNEAGDNKELRIENFTASAATAPKATAAPPPAVVSEAQGYVNITSDDKKDEVSAREKTAKAKASPEQDRALSNVFRGRVTDENNNALPFANITNPVDQVGTYADAQGNFTLVSSDSVLRVQVRSLGFEPAEVALNTEAPANNIVLQDDRSSMNAFLVSNRSMNNNRSRSSHMILEEPEPADGWTNYDTYLTNNLNVPDNYRSRQAPGGQVELSFEVDTNGDPVNIKVVRSLCESCDREAIRLVKEGPKWKRKDGASRTSVTVSF